MKVLMTADTVGGVWTYAIELARALAAHRVEVVLATMGAAPSAAQRAEAAAIRGLRLHASEFRLEWMPEPWDDVARAGDWLLELAERESVDLVHLGGYAHASLPWRVPTVVVAHSCVASWWEAVKREPLPREWGRYIDAVGAGIHAASAVVAPSRAMLDAVERHYGRPRDGRVIANARDATRFVPLRKEATVLAVGRLWDEAKNVAALAAIAPELPWPVRVAGNASAPDGEAVALPNVELLGRLDERAMASMLGRAAIYALPARYEPFGLSVLEASLCGCALVLGDLPSLREVWGDAALFVVPDDGAALRDAIGALCDDAPRRAEWVRRARVRALELSPGRMAAAYLDLYRALLERRTEVAIAERTDGEVIACAS